MPFFKTIFASSVFFLRPFIIRYSRDVKHHNYSIAVQLRYVHECAFVDQDGPRKRIGATGRNPGMIPGKILGRIPGRIGAAGRTTKKASMDLWWVKCCHVGSAHLSSFQVLLWPVEPISTSPNAPSVQLGSVAPSGQVTKDWMVYYAWVDYMSIIYHQVKYINI